MRNRRLDSYVPKVWGPETNISPVYRPVVCNEVMDWRMGSKIDLESEEWVPYVGCEIPMDID